MPNLNVHRPAPVGFQHRQQPFNQRPGFAGSPGTFVAPPRGRPLPIGQGRPPASPAASGPSRYADVLSAADQWMGLVGADPSHADAHFGQFRNYMEDLVPRMQHALNSLPLLKSPYAVQCQMHGIGESLRHAWQTRGAPPVLVHGELRGTGLSNGAFLDSLRQALAAGISLVAIEQPAGMSSLDKTVGGRLRMLIGKGRVDEVKQVLQRANIPPSRTTRALVEAATNVRSARDLGFAVKLLDLADAPDGSTAGRQQHLAASVVKLARQGRGVMVATPALNAGDVTALVREGGLPVAGVSFLSNGPQTPESALCLRHYLNIGMGGDRDFRALRLDQGLGAGRSGARPHTPQHAQAAHRPPAGQGGQASHAQHAQHAAIGHQGGHGQQRWHLPGQA